MSKKYSLYVKNDNLYGCSGTYKVMDGKGTVITDTTALTLDASGKTKIGEQTVADTEVAYWGGTKFTFTSVGAPTSVSGEINRNDYHYYDLSATPITYYFGNNFSMSFSLAITAISGQTITYPKVFSIATNKNFTNAESVSFASAGTQSLHYTESNFGGDKGTGYLYIKDTENNAVYMFVNTLKIFNKPTLTQTSISASGATYSVVFTATNPNDIACNLWTTNYTEAFTDQGTISANGTLSFTITSSSTTGIAHAYLKFDNVQSTENSKSWEYTPTLTSIVLNSATLHSDGTLEVSYTNCNSVNVSGLFYWQGGAYNASETFTTGTHTLTETGVPTDSSSCFVGTISATGYNDGSTSNTLTYTVTTLSTIYVNGASSVSVGGTANIYITDSAGDAISGITVSTGSSTTFSISLVSGAQYQLTGISAGTGTLYLGATGYTSKSVTITTDSKYTLTVEYYKNGVIDDTLTTTSQIEGGATVSPGDYATSISGYTYNHSNPSSSFTMTGNTTIEMYYVAVSSVSLDFGYYDSSYNSIDTRSSLSFANGDIVNPNTYKNSISGYTYTQTLVTDSSKNDYDITGVTSWALNGNTSFSYIYNAVTPTLSTIYFNGASSVEVGSTSNIYISDSAGDAISGLAVVSSDTGIGTIELVSGTLYHLAGVTAGTFIITASATGYTSNSHSITSSLPTPTLSQPEIAYDDTVEANQDGSYNKKSVVSVKNSNSNRVSYSASVDGVKSFGSLEPNATATIGTWEITDSYGSDTFSVSCSFTASSFEPSSATDSHTL